MRFNVRQLHRRVAPYILILLTISAITGLAYRVGRSWIGIDRPAGQKIMDLHTGAWLGDFGSSLYVLAVGLGTLFLVGTGVAMLRKSQSRQPARRWHRILGLACLLPLTATALTGVLYMAGESWLGFSEETSDLLMSIHEGGWLGRTWKPYYVALLGSATLALSVAGLILLLPARWFRGK